MTDMQKTPENNEETKPVDRPVHIPQKFWNAATGEVDVEKLLNSYLALEKKLSADEEEVDRASLLKRLGCPDTADEYDVTIPEDLFEPDIELNQRLHAKGFTNEQVQEVYNLAVEKMIPIFRDMVLEMKAEREMDKLMDYFGGADRYAKMAKQMLLWGQKNLSPQMLESLSSSYEGVITLSQLMQGKDPKISGGSASPRDPESDLLSMMRDPRYWEKRDPNFIAKVTQGFEELYG